MSDELKSIARRTYFAARERQDVTHWGALGVVLPMLQHHLRKQQADIDHGVQRAVLAKLPSRLEVDAWAAEEAWDAQFTMLQQESFRDNLRSPDDEESRFRLRLDAQMRSVEFNEDLLRSVQAESEVPGFTISEAYIIKLDRAQRAYDASCKRLESLEDQARKHLLEKSSGPAAQAEIAAIKQRLIDEYGGRGPQYEILCGMLADLEYQRAQTRSSGRDVVITEVVALNQAVLSTINQLQKFTESTKSESLSKDRNELGVALMTIMEKHFLATQPQLWAKALAEVKQRLGAPESSPRPTMLRLMPVSAESTALPED